MYLMNVPPVATGHTEWRRCGAQEGYSLPVFLHDSDSDLSTSGRPLSDKVQMIIESLRSSQSSLEMGDAIEGNVPSGQEGKPQVCKVPTGTFVRPKSNSKGTTKTQRTDCSYPDRDRSSDSDSDDSVDRGIEEAILEYLKEKDGRKRKAEPCFNFMQSPKIPRKTPFISDIPKQNPEGSECLLTGNTHLKKAQIESSVARIIPVKKQIKYKHSLNENVVKRFDSNKRTTNKSALPKENTKSPSKAIGAPNKAQGPVAVTTEEGSDDSSSDDGIEEAIQRYQLEKKEQENRGESFSLLSVKDDSDSTSDDGIEEAIRHYQLEQFKERHVLKPFLHKQKPFSKSLVRTSDGASVEKISKDKPKKKRTAKGRGPGSHRAPPTSCSVPKKSSSDCAKGKASSGSLHFAAEQHASTSAPPKANTTAELMCAEAILDISKTVMPAAFQHGVALGGSAPTESQLRVSLPEKSLTEESDSSSVDSEDGIEQEIRKFLEQKAQMHKQPIASAAPHCQSVGRSEEIRAKVSVQKKPPRLSKIRQHSGISGLSRTDRNAAAPSVLPENGKELGSLLLPTERRATQQTVGVDQIPQRDDKSSSLDSDEDLDTAIKDLLKTKKKSKRKNRDLKWKSRKCLREDGPTATGNTLKKVKKTKDEPKTKSGLAKAAVARPKQPQKEGAPGIVDGKKEKCKATEGQRALSLRSARAALQSKDDSSSGDSDDGIEQEIQRFLAEKAKGAAGEATQEGDAPTTGSPRLKDEGAEIPVQNPGPQPGRSPFSAQPDSSTADAQSCQPSVQPSGPSLLEPADGVGAARSEQASILERVGLQTLTPQAGKVHNSKIALSSPQSIKWRQSLGLPTPKSWTFGQTPFHITTSKLGETTAASSQFPSRRLISTSKSQSPVAAGSPARAGRGPLAFSKEAVAKAATKSPDSNLFHAARQHQRLPFTQSLAQGHRSKCPAREGGGGGGGETKSLVSMPKDRCVFVELESNRTNHVQVRSEGKDRAALLSEWKKGGEMAKSGDKAARGETTEEEFIDEADCRSSDRVNPDKRQGFPKLSLCRAIDPGITFSPCIALCTEERSQVFRRRNQTKRLSKFQGRFQSDNSVSVQSKDFEHVKRKLQFTPVSRTNEGPVNHSLPQ